MLKFTLKNGQKLAYGQGLGWCSVSTFTPLTIAVRYPNKMIASHCPLDLTYITAYSFLKKWKSVSLPFGVD